MRWNTEFKVGLTVNPDRRWSDHARHEWREMVVVYATSSRSYAAAAERELIEHGWASHIDCESFNLVRGGGGARHGYSEYYIYVLLA